MRRVAFLLPLLLASGVSAHPGAGIVALSEDVVVFADPTENILWRAGLGRAPERLVSRFHGHWITRGLDGRVYVEAFQESGGAWSSAAFRLDLDGARLTEVAHRDELGALAFAVDRDGALVFQRGPSLVSRSQSRESAFRPHPGRPALDHVTAYAWSEAGDLLVADRNRILRIDPTGVTSRVAEFRGRVFEPRIWNAGDTPGVTGLAVHESNVVFATSPDLGKVFRIGKEGVPEELPSSQDGWRATGVAVSGTSVLLLESDPRASTSPRVRILGEDGSTRILNVPGPAKATP